MEVDDFVNDVDTAKFILRLEAVLETIDAESADQEDKEEGEIVYFHYKVASNVTARGGHAITTTIAAAIHAIIAAPPFPLSPVEIKQRVPVQRRI